MKSGVLLFALNNGHYDYVKMAAWNADNIRRWLNVEVAMVTNVDSVPDKFDHVIYARETLSNQRYFPDLATKGHWYNTNRIDAFELSPFDRTLVLDVDYVVATNDLARVLEMQQDFLCFRNAYDVSNSDPSFNDLNYFGEHRFPMSWATVMVFNRTQQTEFVFDSMRMIRDNWDHYRNIYKIMRKDYRNDYALSIALGLVSGHTNQINYIPWALATVPPTVEVHKIDYDEYYFSFKRNNKSTWMSFKNIDFHMLGKVDMENLIDHA